MALSEDCDAIAERVAELLSRAGGRVRQKSSHEVDESATLGPPRATVVIALDPRLEIWRVPASRHGRGPGPETEPSSYRIVIDADQVRLTARDVAGMHGALSTLEQLLALSRDADSPLALPCLLIEDAPRYAWRGLTIDIARHFHGPPTLRDVIDLAALYKLNALHLHLSDDQGWRIEIPSRPELTERSSHSQVGDGDGGHLTVGEWKELVAYAAGRGITLIPEIDLPGHVNAALHAIPALNPDGAAAKEYRGIEVGFSRLDLGLPETEPFLRDVIADLAAMTPGPWLHLGGDEVEEMSADEYVRFVEVATGIAAEHGKRVIVWHEAGKAALPPSSLVQLWVTPHATTPAPSEPEQPGPPGDDADSEQVAALPTGDGETAALSRAAPILAAVARGNRIIMSPGSRAYLDMRYHSDFPLGLEWAGCTEVRDSYDWDPGAFQPGLDPGAVEGVSAAIWTETLATKDELFTMLLPRLAAIAEVAWSEQPRRDWPDFARRLARHAPIWRERGWTFHPSEQIDWEDGRPGSDAGEADRRRAAIPAASGSLTGMHEDGYLDRLREDWPQ